MKRRSRVLGGEEASCRAPSSRVCRRSDTDGPGAISLWEGQSTHSDGTGNQACHLNRQTHIIFYLTTIFGFALSKKAIKIFIRNQRGELLPDRSSRGHEQQMKHVYVEVCYRDTFSVAVLSHFKSPKNGDSVVFKRASLERCIGDCPAPWQGAYPAKPTAGSRHHAFMCHVNVEQLKV